ncbi:hypothetical protein J658_0294 [Acinetobacter baumannii 573719]|nr:hypothetical protein J658_0294 [Acinetobacter baumannii 573719]
MDRKQFEEWFKTTDAYKLLEEMNYFKIDLFIFKEHRSQYQHTTVQIAYMTWQYRFTRMVELEAAVDSLSDENAHFRNKKWDQNEDLTKLQAKVEEVQKQFDQHDKLLLQRNKDVQELYNINAKHVAEKAELQKRVDFLEKHLKPCECGSKEISVDQEGYITKHCYRCGGIKTQEMIEQALKGEGL